MNKKIMLITGTSKGIGRYLADYYIQKGYHVIGCSRSEFDEVNDNYTHFSLDVSDERAVKDMFTKIRRTYGHLDVLINNAGIASMNHALLTTIDVAHKILNTNVVGTFLFCREAAKIMKKIKNGRIVNFVSIAIPLKLEGEAIYAASKAAIVCLTQILAKEFAKLDITINAIGPTPIKTDLIAKIPSEKIDSLISMQAIQRYGEFPDISNLIDFFIKPESNFITGQVIYLGGL